MFPFTILLESRRQLNYLNLNMKLVFHVNFIPDFIQEVRRSIQLEIGRKVGAWKGEFQVRFKSNREKAAEEPSSKRGAS